MDTVWRVLILFSAALGVSCGRPIIIPKGEIAGHLYVSGPLVGAVVKAYQVGADGKPTGQPLGQSSPSDEKGAFRVSIGSGHGTIYLEAQGPATYVELYGGAKVSLDPGVIVSGLVMDVNADELREGAVLTGLTHVAVSLARARVAAGKEATFDAAAQRAYELLSEHFMECDLWTTQPEDIGMPSAALTPAVRYALVLAAVSYLAQQMGSKSSPTLTLNDSNSLILLKLLADDVSSSEALFNGKSPQADLRLGNCATPCALSSSTARTDLSRALVDFLSSPLNRSGQDYDRVLGRIDAMAMNQDPELFPPGDGGNPSIDTLPPVITWISPQEGDVVSGTVTVEVQAQDATQVASLGVLHGETQLADGDPTPGRFRSEITTQALADGPLVLTASAADVAGNRSTKAVNLTVNNLGPGTINGVCVKGPVKGAQVIAYRYANGVRSEPIGTTATTDQVEGKFRLEGVEDWTGPLLITCSGPAYYDEEAFTFATDLGSGDKLRAVVKDFATNSATVTLTAWTTLAIAYQEFLMRGGMPFAQARDQAYRTMGEVVGLEDLERARPARLDATVTTFNVGTWSAFLDAGLSQLAVMYATRGGVATGAAINSKLLLQKLEADIGADGCFDGRDAAGPLQVGGVSLTSQTLRYDLALAVATYLTSSRNLTMIRSASDAINQLDALTSQGPTSGGCAAGEVFPEAGHASFDRVGPQITWDATLPPPGSYIDGAQADALTVKATARDDLSPRPALTFVAPTTMGIRDEDGDPTNQTVVARVPAGFEGDLTLKLQARDDAGNTTLSEERVYHIDRSGLAPTITLLNVSRPDRWTSSPTVAIQVTSKDPMAQLSVTLDGVAVGVSSMEDRAGAHVVVATAMGATGTRTSTASFVIDTLPPEIVPAFPASMYAKSGVTVTAYLDDALKGLPEGGSLPADATPPLFDAEVTWDGGSGPMVTRKLERDAMGRLKLDAYLPLYDGGVTVKFVGQDRVGNVAQPKEWKGVIDSLPPMAELLLFTGADLGQPLDLLNPWTRMGVKVDVKVTNANEQAEPNVDHVSALIGGQMFTTLPQTVTADGEKAVSVVVYDKAGWESNNAERTFYIDTGKPVIAVTATCNQTACGSPAFIRNQLALTAVLAEGDSAVAQALQQAGSLQGPAQFLGSVEMKPPQLALVPGTGSGGFTKTLMGSMVPTSVHDGDVVVTFTGADRAGNEAVGNEPTRYVWRGIIDTQKPIVQLALKPRTVGLFSATNKWARDEVTIEAKAVNASGLAEANHDRFEITLDGVKTSDQNNPGSRIVTSPDGAHSVSVIAYDDAGWVSDPAAETFYLDRMSPVIEEPLVENIAGGTVGTWLKTGDYRVTAIMNDNLKSALAASSSLASPAELKGAQVGTVAGITVTVDGQTATQSDGKLQRAATVKVDPGASGKVTLSFTGNDRAGNAALAKTWERSIDSVLPLIDGTTATGTWTGKMNATEDSTTVTSDFDVKVSARDSGSGIARVEVYRGTGMTPIASKPFGNVPSITDAPVTVKLLASKSTCSDAGAKNTLRIKVIDQAENSAERTIDVYLDVCPPTITVASKQMVNEKTWSPSGVTAPFCFTGSGGAADPLYPASPPPKVYKYRVTMDGAGSCRPSSNQVKWLLNVTDRGDTNLVSLVTFRLKNGTDVDIGGTATRKPSVNPDPATPDRTHEILVSTALTQEVAKRDGLWKVEVTATDALGNSSAAMVLQWEQYLIDGPLSIEGIPVQSDWGWMEAPLPGLVNPFARGLTAGLDMAGIDGTGGRPIGIYLFRITNQTPYDAYVRVSPTVTANLTRKLIERNVSLSEVAGQNTACNGYAAFHPPTASGSNCLSTLPGFADPEYDRSETGRDLAPGTRALRFNGSAYTAFAEGCPAQSGSWCTANTWKVSGGEATDVWVTAASLFPWPTDGTLSVGDKFFNYAGVNWDLYGGKVYSSGWGTDYLDPEAGQWFIDRYDRYRYLRHFKVRIGFGETGAKADIDTPIRDGSGVIASPERFFDFYWEHAEDQQLP